MSLHQCFESKILIELSSINFHGCKLPGLGTYHFSPILLPTRKSGTIRHLENGENQNFTEAFRRFSAIVF